MKNDEYFLELAFKEAEKANRKAEIPVGAIIVKDNIIISKGHNQRDNTNIVTKHAEIIAIEKANKKLKNWRLIDCVLYCTLEPCDMCKEVIKNSKIEKVIYAASSTEDKVKLKTAEYVQISDINIQSKNIELLKSAFKNIRSKK